MTWLTKMPFAQPELSTRVSFGRISDRFVKLEGLWRPVLSSSGRGITIAVNLEVLVLLRSAMTRLTEVDVFTLETRFSRSPDRETDRRTVSIQIEIGLDGIVRKAA